MKENYLRRAQRGMRLMTAKKGKGWVNSVNLDTFDVTLPWNCVVGQNYGGQPGCYSAGLNDLFGRDIVRHFDLVVAHGFDLPRSVSDADWERLQAVWVKLITAAREG